MSESTWQPGDIVFYVDDTDDLHRVTVKSVTPYSLHIHMPETGSGWYGQIDPEDAGRTPLEAYEKRVESCRDALSRAEYHRDKYKDEPAVQGQGTLE